MLHVSVMCVLGVFFKLDYGDAVASVTADLRFVHAKVRIYLSNKSLPTQCGTML